jgi:hypothetical protein
MWSLNVSEEEYQIQTGNIQPILLSEVEVDVERQPIQRINLKLEEEKKEEKPNKA